MASIDWPLEKLVDYRPAPTRQDDFDSFWADTLAAARRLELAPEIEPFEYPIPGVRAHRVTYAGFGGHRIHGLYLLPAGDGPFPAVA